MNILQEELASQGYTVVPGAVDAASLEALLEGFREFVAGETGQHFGDLFTGPIVDHFHSHPDDESRVYDGFRRTRHLSELSLQLAALSSSNTTTAPFGIRGRKASSAALVGS